MTSEAGYRQAEYDLQRLRVDLRGQLARVLCLGEQLARHWALTGARQRATL